MHAVTRPPEPFSACDGAARVHAVPAASDNIVWILQCASTGACAVIDGPPDPAILAYVDDHGLDVRAIWNTHTHGDHIGVNRLFAQAGRLEGLDVVGPARGVPGQTRAVGEGDTVTLGDLVGRVMLTEGHIDGHVSYVVGDLLFCGDTLFAGGCGYLFDGPPSKMFHSLLRMAELPPDTRVCCAHEYTLDNLRFAWTVEPDNAALADRIRRVRALRAVGRCTLPSTIAEERATNPFLRPGSPTIVAAVGGGPTPLDVFTATRALKDTRAYKAVPDDALPG